MGTTLYVREQGAQVRRVSQRIQIVRGTETLTTVRLRDLERLVLFGNVDLSASAMTALLEAGVETTLLSYGGKLRGRLAPAEGKNVFLRQRQFQRYEQEPFRLEIARIVLAAKVRNARTVLVRYQRNHPDAELSASIATLERGRERLANQTSIASLLGVEGDCARVYFGVLGRMVRSEFMFTVRSRRPPRDPVNAMLSFGYALLGAELTGAVAAQGLDPHVGMLHELDYGRPSLALDILEEFRQPVVDRLVLSLVNLGILQTEHFDNRGEAGTLLNDSGRPKYIEYYHRALETPFEDRDTLEKTCFRDLLQRQAQRMRRAIEGDETYAPYTLR